MTAEVTVRLANGADSLAIAALHASSWQSAYRGLFSDAFLDGPVVAERQHFWRRRFATWDPLRNDVILALRESSLLGFAAVLLDEEPVWGARLDNLHVHPHSKGSGIGRLLLGHAAHWTLQRAPSVALHLMVFEANAAARRFYDNLHGEFVERRQVTVEDGTQLTELRYVWRDLAALSTAVRLMQPG